MSQAVSAPKKAGQFALWTLILAACVANLNLTVANVALPDIGRALGATQIELNMVAVGFTLGLASSVLYLGAIGDRYGRKKLLLLGLALSIPAAAMAAWAPGPPALIAARFLGGVCAGMVYPTTLSIITALYVGKQRVMAIALWSGIGASIAAVGPAVVGWLLTFAWWGAGFAISIPLAAFAFLLCLRLPAKTGDLSPSVDHVGGILSVVMIGTLITAITFAPTPGAGTIAIGLGVIAVTAIIAFYLWERRAAHPLFDLRIARRRTFWVAALAGIIVFGSLMGAMFIGMQFLQNVIGYNPLQAGAGIMPAAIAMILLSPVAAILIRRIGSRWTLAIGFVLVGLGFAAMFIWTENSPYWLVGTTYVLLGAGVSVAAAPASRSIMASVPPQDLGMGSATNDLQRDLGGAIMQSVMGSLLVVRYSKDITEAFNAAPANQQSSLSDQAITLMTQSFTGAQEVAQTVPAQYSTALLQAAKQAFTEGANVAYASALLAVVVGLVIIVALYPRKENETQILAEYAQEQAAPDGSSAPR
ncbi:MAG: MFS transporter [Candidatus Nanopelagicales bacterium]